MIEENNLMPPAAPAPQVQPPADREPRRHPLLLIAGIVGVLLFLCLVLTCPDRTAHRNAVVSQINGALGEEFDRMAASSDSESLGLFGSMLASKVVEMAIDSRLEVSNYFLFSVSRITLGGESHTLSYGFLNHVYTFEKTDLTRALKEVSEEKK